MTRPGRAGVFSVLSAVTAAGMAIAGSSHAGTDLFGPEAYAAWADIRLHSSDGETGWLDGGFGKLRYSGEGTKADLAQAALLWKPRLADTVTAYVLLQDVPDAENPWGISEAYIKWKPVPTSDTRFSIRAGQMFPPISMEHDGTGWTTTRTLTPSAINSWVGEEVLVDGVEATLQKSLGSHEVAATAGVFSRDDTAGTILSWRGWALHDISSADNTELPLPSGPQGYAAIFGPYQAYESKPMVEVDHRLGFYLRADWRPPVPVAFNFEYYDNQGNPNAVRNAQWGWSTRFYNLGAQYQFSGKDEVLSQYMTGHTRMGGEDGLGDGRDIIDVAFDSAYLLWSHHLDDGARLSGRLDYFAAKDFSLRAIDDNTDKGYSATVAWMKPVSEHLNLAVEVLQVVSDHPARITQNEIPRQSQTQIQVALKLHL